MKLLFLGAALSLVGSVALAAPKAKQPVQSKAASRPTPFKKPSLPPMAIPKTVVAPVLKIGIVHAPTAQSLKGPDYLKFMQRVQDAAKSQGAVFVVDDKSILYKADNENGLSVVDLTPYVSDLLPTESDVIAQKAVEQKATEAQTQLQAKNRLFAKRALASLGLLTADIDTGATRQSYATRMAAVHLEVSEQLAEMSPGELKTQIQDVLQSYEDANDWWSDIGKFAYPKIYLVSTDGAQLIEKYNLEIDEPKTFEKVYENQVTYAKYITAPLKQIWATAKGKMDLVTKTLDDSDTFQ